MKKITLFLFMFVVSGIISITAQQTNIYDNPDYGADSTTRIECANNLSTMSEFMKINLFDYALPSWKAVFDECPASSLNIYIYGTKIYRELLDKEKDDARKTELLDTLILIYDRRIEYFGEEGIQTGRKALDLFKYDRKQHVQVYEMLQKSIELSKGESEVSVLMTYMQLSNAFYKARVIESQELIDNYLIITDILNAQIRAGKDKKQNERALQNVEAIFAESGAADCEALIEIFGPKLEAAPENLDLLKKVTDLLSNRKCEDSELYARAAENLYRLEPSSSSAYKLARLFFKKEDYEKSAEYYEKAIETASENETAAQYSYELAYITFSKFDDYIQCRKLALDAARLKPSWGQPYILIGNVYASSQKMCGENDFEKSAVFWAAVDKFEKAKSVDPSLASEASELIGKYSQYFPNAEDAFFYGFQDGQEFKVGCWINEATRVRTKS